jgi:hypothetical protein
VTALTVPFATVWWVGRMRGRRTAKRKRQVSVRRVDVPNR